MNEQTIETLEKLEKTADEFWNVSHQTGNFMNMLVKIMNAKKVLEIGTSNGYSGLWFADALNETQGKLTTVEFWEKRQCLAKANIEYCGLSHVVNFKTGDAYEVITTEIEDEFDIIFIDANKKEYIRYFEAVHPLLRKGGVILADNITSHLEKTKPFVNAISSHKDYQTQILDLPDGLLMAYKIGE